MDAAFYTFIFALIIYGVFAPWQSARIIAKTGESERFWFYVLLITNFWGLLFILLRPSFRKGIAKNGLATLTFLAIGYWAIILPLWAILGAFK